MECFQLRKIFIFVFFVIYGSLWVSSCGSDKGKPEDSLNITGVSIPSEIDVTQGGTVTITGKGFAVGDLVFLYFVDDENRNYSSAIAAVTGQSMDFPLPDGVTTGRYRIVIERNGQTVSLGTTTVNIVVDNNIPDIEGMTVKGMVHSNGAGLPGVVVSDGYEVTVTNENGIYYLPSEKRTGYVFISVPGNYEVTNNINAPQFFKRTGKSAVDQADFSLVPANNNNHIVIAMADWHLADRNNDLQQFGNFLTDVNRLIDDYSKAGKKVYGLTLGDMTWDNYWYSNKFSLANYITWMNKVDCPVFNVMGNHDNDPYKPGDWVAEQAYRNTVGPTYFSFNLGKVHYIVLDNTVYINSGASEGVIGSRSYTNTITTDQIEWLKRDLATLNDKSSPIVVAMHIPLYKAPALSGNNQTNAINLINGQAFINCLAEFDKVHVLSGHTHVSYTAEPSAKLMEHNISAVCATWWWTGKNGYANNHICKDGSVGGYSIFDIAGEQLEWYYKSIGYEKNYQFRTYDLNKIQITADKYAPAANITYADKMPGYAGSYAAANANNEVLINVWGYDTKWKVEVHENGRPLTVARVSAKDPLHIISYEAKRLNVNTEPTESFITSNTAHFFKVTASQPNTTLEIKVTDRFGNEYTETMARPKNFDYNMR